MDKYQDINIDKLFELSASEHEEDWDNYFKEFPYIFAPGPWKTRDPQYCDVDDAFDLFDGYMWKSIEYWNIYCLTKQRESNNKTRIDGLVKAYENIWNHEKPDKDEPFAFSNLNKNKIRQMDYSSIQYLSQLRTQTVDYAVSNLRYFADNMTCIVLYSFLDKILSDMVFQVSERKCFDNNLKRKHSYLWDDSYRDLDRDLIIHNIKKPKKSHFDNDDEYYKRMKIYNDATLKNLPSIHNRVFQNFYNKNKLPGKVLPDYMIKAKYIDKKCGSDLYDLIDKEDKFKAFNAKRNDVMHSNPVTTQIETMDCFLLIKEVLDYFFKNKKIHKQWDAALSEDMYII